jgi:predicted alpha/beta hydrolase
VTEVLRTCVDAAEITALDGIGVKGYVYRREGEARYTVLVLPGIGVPQRVFRPFASWLASRGVRTVTVDYRGMGESNAPAAFATATLTAWASSDAVAALRFAETFGDPVVLVGHSFGGQVLGFSDEFRRLAGAILVGSQFGQARHWDGLARLKLAAYWRAILPLSAALFAVVPAWTGLGAALPRGVAREWARFGRTHDWLLSHVPGARERYATFDRPLRAYAMTDDPIAPPRAVSDLLSRFRATDVERCVLSPETLGVKRLGHLGPFRSGSGERLWPELEAFASACLRRGSATLRARVLAHERNETRTHREGTPGTA